jgi:DNA-binding PadR family transcriptional regulator
MNGGATREQHAGAMRSSIAWALLGLVIERPSYGYELMQRFRRVYGETLVLSSHTRIYTALDALRVRGLIEEMTDGPHGPSTSRRPKPRYRATEEGVGAYQEWLFNQMEEERQRHRLFARQLAMLEPPAALEVLDEYERQCLLQSDDVASDEGEREGVAERLADEEEQSSLEVRLTWIEYARKELKALLHEQAKDGGGSGGQGEGSPAHGGGGPAQADDTPPQGNGSAEQDLGSSEAGGER